VEDHLPLCKHDRLPIPDALKLSVVDPYDPLFPPVDGVCQQDYVRLFTCVDETGFEQQVFDRVDHVLASMKRELKQKTKNSPSSSSTASLITPTTRASVLIAEYANPSNEAVETKLRIRAGILRPGHDRFHSLSCFYAYLLYSMHVPPHDAAFIVTVSGYHRHRWTEPVHPAPHYTALAREREAWCTCTHACSCLKAPPYSDPSLPASRTVADEKQLSDRLAAPVPRGSCAYKGLLGLTPREFMHITSLQDWSVMVTRPFQYIPTTPDELQASSSLAGRLMTRTFSTKYLPRHVEYFIQQLHVSCGGMIDPWKDPDDDEHSSIGLGMVYGVAEDGETRTELPIE
jgi:hypothetical protein